jgi:hypothetical protein
MNKEEILKKLIKTEDKIFASKVLDKFNKCEKSGSLSSTDFLDPYQRNIAQRVISEWQKTNKADTNYIFYGGYEGAERVLMIFRPPMEVPTPIAAAHATMTSQGTVFVWITPAPNRAMVMIPMDFCASLLPCENAIIAADKICILENHLFTVDCESFRSNSYKSVIKK